MVLRSIAFSIFIITFTAASLIEVFENHEAWYPEYVPPNREYGLTFLDCYYFILVTITTIG